MASEKEIVALGSIVASGGMTVGKFAVGVATGSLGLISEGAHSLLDLGATAMTYFAVRVSDKPADAEHPYGHGKIESVSALIETGLLFLTSAGIVYEAVHRLLTGDMEVETTWWSVAVLLASIAIDAYRARELARVAKATNSQALEADALHFSSDILSSSVVLIGLGLVWLGYPKGDAVAAIGVSVFVCLAGYRLGRRTIDTLIDAAPSGSTQRVAAIVGAVPGIAAVRRVRIRPAGHVLFVDLDVAVRRALPLNRVAEIEAQVVRAVTAELAQAEVGVTAHPLAMDDETVVERVMVCAADLGVAVHHITVQRVAGRLSVSFDMEVNGRQSIRTAHATSLRLEEAIQAEFGAEIEVETHIEPLQVDGWEGTDVETDLLAAMTSRMGALVAESGRLLDVHNVRVRRTPSGLVVNFHSHVGPDLTVSEVHDAVDGLERHIREQWPETCRVVGHPEPAHGLPTSMDQGVVGTA